MLKVFLGVLVGGLFCVSSSFAMLGQHEGEREGRRPRSISSSGPRFAVHQLIDHLIKDDLDSAQFHCGDQHTLMRQSLPSGKPLESYTKEEQEINDIAVLFEKMNRLLMSSNKDSEEYKATLAKFQAYLDEHSSPRNSYESQRSSQGSCASSLNEDTYGLSEGVLEAAMKELYESFEMGLRIGRAKIEEEEEKAREQVAQRKALAKSSIAWRASEVAKFNKNSSIEDLRRYRQENLTEVLQKGQTLSVGSLNTADLDPLMVKAAIKGAFQKFFPESFPLKKADGIRIICSKEQFQGYLNLFLDNKFEDQSQESQALVFHTCGLALKMLMQEYVHEDVEYRDDRGLKEFSVAVVRSYFEEIVSNDEMIDWVFVTYVKLLQQAFNETGTPLELKFRQIT